MTTKFPALHSTLAPTELGRLIQKQYNLSDKTHCSIFRLGMNHLYVVQDGETTYVFRVYTHNWRTKIEIEEELRLLNHLKENKTQVAYPITDKENKQIQEIEAPEGKRFGVLFSYAKGIKTARFSAQTSYVIGQALAHVHQAAENFTTSRITYNTQNLLDQAIVRTKAFFTKPNSDIEFLEKMTAFLTLKMNELDPQKMRIGSVHLDVWFDNLHIDNEKEVTFFDFDFCGNGYLCLDISYYLFELLATNLNEEEYQQKAESFLQGYETVTKISEEEKQFLPFACLAIMNYYISIQCDRFDYWTNIFVNEDHLRRMVGNLKRWMAYNKIEIGE